MSPRQHPRVSQTRLRRLMLRWYRREGRHDLPWRARRDAWDVLVAELMLQRTRADLVVPVYQALTDRWPDAASLAAAPPDEVASIVRPLGLRHRNARLQAAADACRAGVPRTYRGLLELPGVGRYAATATLCFAFGRRLGVIDPSVLRILDRVGVAASARGRPRDDPALWQAATELVPRHAAREWNYAMLDLGAVICRPRPRCTECPLLRLCDEGQARLAIGQV